MTQAEQLSAQKEVIRICLGMQSQTCPLPPSFG